MTLWKVVACYPDDKPTFVVLPYDFFGHLKCCWKWYGIKGLKWCYLSCKQAEKKADRLNRDVRKVYKEDK